MQINSYLIGAVVAGADRSDEAEGQDEGDERLHFRAVQRFFLYQRVRVTFLDDERVRFEEPK